MVRGDLRGTNYGGTVGRDGNGGGIREGSFTGVKNVARGWGRDVIGGKGRGNGRWRWDYSKCAPLPPSPPL